MSLSVLRARHSKSLHCLTWESGATDPKLPLWRPATDGWGERCEMLQYEMLTWNDDWHFLPLKFQIYDCFLLVFCFLLYFPDLCLRVLMPSYNEKTRSLLHVCSILFHPHVNDTISSPLSATESSYSSVPSWAIGLHMSAETNSTSPPLAWVPQEGLR